VTDVAEAGGSKPATAARIYDYHLGGTHNFPADREAGMAVAAMFPLVSVIARTNRAFLQRAVRYAAGQGVRQFLDLGAGIPTQGNVHEVADAVIDDARVVYVDIDPVAVSESLDILQGNTRATAVWGDVRDPQPILDNPQVRALIDFDQPVALLLVGVLHFVPDEIAYDAVQQLLGALAPGSLLIVSHAAADAQDFDKDNLDTMKDIYRQRTATPLHLRTRDGVARFFEGLELAEPGLTWVSSWRPEPTDPQDLVSTPQLSAGHVAVGRIP
jgi:O-methyltransferase involved in polyketide biosynthesis